MGNLPEDFHEAHFNECYNAWPPKVKDAYYKVKEKILYTVEDQPYIDGEIHWVCGEEVELWEVLEDCRVPEKYWDNFVDLLGFDSKHDSVGIEEEWVREQKELEKRVQRKYGARIEEFQTHLELFPMLGLRHTIGKRIIRELLSFSLMEIKDEDFYRARKMDGEKILTSEEMLAPPVGIAGEGRYNHPGMSVLYLAESEQGAALEVVENSKKPCVVWMQKLKVISLDKILDFNYRVSTFVDFPPENELLHAAFLRGIFEQEVKERNRQGKPEYLITRFVTDCARMHGLNGVYYSSTRSFDTNLVLFDNSHIPPTISLVDQPYIFSYYPSDGSLDF